MDFVELLTKHRSIRVAQQASNWEEAIRVCGQPLVSQGLILPSYIDSIIESTKEHGPYYIIAPFIAMPHSADRDSIIEDCFSLVVLSQPVYFEGDERPVQILVLLAARYADTHTTVALPQIVAVFEDSDTVARMIAATTEDEVLEIIKHIDYRRYLD